MKKLLASTAVALMAAGPVLAQATSDQPAATTPPAATAGTNAPASGNTGGAAVVLFLATAEPDAIFASDLIGMEVYSSQADYAGSYGGDRAVPAADTSQWDDIGEVNDIVMTPDGQARGVLVDIGGFLGIGEHTVALDMSQVHLLRDDTNRRFMAVNSSREELENAPEYERPSAPPATADNSAMSDTGMTGTADGTGTGAGMATRPAFEREGFTTADYGALTAEQLEGATVYDGQDESVGEIGELLLSADGKIERAVVDVGGFLGMGEHQIALDFNEMQVMTNSDNSEVRVYIDQSREELEARPEYEQ
jgi:sporulation protein YlmC with PRC-barrel domain